MTLEQAEGSHILQTREPTEGLIGSRNGAAARLGLPRTTLNLKSCCLRIGRQGEIRNPNQLTQGITRSDNSMSDRMPRVRSRQVKGRRRQTNARAAIKVSDSPTSDNDHRRQHQVCYYPGGKWNWATDGMNSSLFSKAKQFS